MSAEDLFMSLKKQHGAGIVLVCAVHNMRSDSREVAANPNIDPSRSHLNVRLAGPNTPEGVAALAQSLMDGAGVGKVRSTAVRCIEVVFSLHPGSPVADELAYFKACAAWAEETFGPVLSADVHNDEAAPHAHVLCLPLTNGRMQGSDLVGVGKKFDALSESFFAEVGAPFGLRRPVRLSGMAKKAAAAAVLKHLKSTGDAALHSQAWEAIRACLEANPAPFMAALGIEPPKQAEKPARSFASIMTSRGRGAKTHAEADKRDRALERTSLIGNEAEPAPATAETQDADSLETTAEKRTPGTASLSSVGKRISTPSTRSKTTPARRGKATARKATPKPGSALQGASVALQQGATP
jgi:hypothetical protein